MSALYAPEFSGGATLVCRRLADELVGLGHAAAVFSGRTTAAEPIGAVARGRVDRAETYRVNVGGALAPWEPEGYWNPAATSAFESFLSEVRPDVVHVHSLQGLGAGLLAAAHARGVPVVVTMHDWWWACPCLFRLSPYGEICPAKVRPERCSGVKEIDFLARRATLRAALASASRIVVPSAFLRRSLIENGIGGEEIVVHENGLPPPSSTPRPIEEHDGPVRFAFIGGAGNHAKGLEVLLRAAVRVDHDFVLDAFSVSAAETRRWADALGPKLRCHEGFPPDRLDEVVAASDAVVVPSLMRESFSLVAREALSRFRPVITSDCGGPEEVVRDGENGLVVASASVGALADALQRFAGDHALRVKLGTGARLEPRTPREHARETQSLYRGVLRECRPARPPTTRRRLAGRRVLFLTGMDGAPLRYRAWNLIERLERAGLRGDVLYHSDVRAGPAASAADVLVLYRAPFSESVARVVAAARARGVLVLFSSDDMVFRTDDLAGAPALDHPDPRVVDGYRQSVEGHERCLAASDAFLGSTPELVDAAAGSGRPGYCLANGLSDRLSALSKRAQRREWSGGGPVRLGFFSGTDTHDADLGMIAPALEEVLERLSDTSLVLAGPVLTPPALERFGARVQRWPFMAWNELPARLASLDVNLAPLDTARPFNLGKSEVKWIEAAAVGVPTVASDAPAFTRASRAGRAAMLCGSTRDWRDGLLRIASDAALRESLGRTSRWEVERRYGSEAQVDDLVSVLADVLDRTPRTDVELPDPVALEAGAGSEVALEPGGRALFDRYQLDAESGGPLRPGSEVVQSFTCERDGLARVDVRVGTYARRNEHEVLLEVRDDDGVTLGTKTVQAERLVDRSFVSVELEEPFRDSAGRRVAVSAAAPRATEGNEILLWHAPSEMGGLTIGGEEQAGRALSFRAFALGDPR